MDMQARLLLEDGNLFTGKPFGGGFYSSYPDHLLEMFQHKRINAIYNQLMEDPF
jgi:hypothetical protein